MAKFEADAESIRGLGGAVERAIGSAEGTLYRASANYGVSGLGAEVTRYSDLMTSGVTRLLDEAREAGNRLLLTAGMYEAADLESAGASKELEAQTPAVAQ